MDPQAAASGVEQPRRRSMFLETGLFDSESQLQPPVSQKKVRPVRKVRFRSKADIMGEDDEDAWEDVTESDVDTPTGTDDEPSKLLSLPSTPVSSRPSRLYRLGILVFLLAITVPLLQTNEIFGGNKYIPLGAKGRVIRHDMSRNSESSEEGTLFKRQDAPTVVCKRWSQQSALVNGTLYLYGGQVMTDASQTTNTWTNDFLTLDLTTSWQISTPSLTGLTAPSGPPKVANGYLWNSHTSLYLYGGEFSDNSDDASATPVPFAMWEYDIPSSKWIEHSSPTTSSGPNSEGDGQPVQRAAEGAGASVAMLGRGWYFGGHLDYKTSYDWSIQVARVYLTSLLEFTFPGSTNSEVNALSGGKTAGTDGNWRNVTQGGLQNSGGFPERADGVLVYIPGFGKQGILLGLAGGDNTTFTQMNEIDVYDIDTSTWYKQATSGNYPGIRVNPCAVVAAAADGSSYNVYMFGGQNLQPYDNQTQYNDMWILSVPAFTWIQVQTSSQVPYARAGHTCDIWDGQMIVVGGYVGEQLSCESPGIYVFNMSSLQWTNQFTALTGKSSNGDAPGAKSGDGLANPWSQQVSQLGDNSTAGLEGSYGYQVPAEVISVIGGSPTGGATVTAPIQSATSGPLATGKPITYTVTGPGGAIITETATPGAGSSSNRGGSGTNIGAIIAGVIAGVFALIAAYFAFCAWVYRRQLQLYKNHTAMAQRAAADPARAEKEAFMVPAGSSKNSSERREESLAGSGGQQTSQSGSGGASGAAAAASLGRRSSGGSSTEDLLAGQEPTFWGSRGVLLNPRRSLRVINRD